MTKLTERHATQCPYCKPSGTLAMRELCILIKRIEGETETVTAIETFCSECRKTINITPAEHGKYTFEEL